MHVFAMVTPPAVAVVAVATETPAVMVLFCFPAAVVGYTIYSDHRQPDPGPSTAATPSPPDLVTPRCGGTSAQHPRPRTGTMDDAAVGRRQARLLRRALGHHGSTAHDVWLDYSRGGGAVGELEVDAYLHESLHLPPAERDLLVRAANGLLGHRPGLVVPTTAQLQFPGPHR
jgi:hypothetical protein